MNDPDFVESFRGSSAEFNSERLAYRLYILDAARHISRGIDIKFPNDEEAISYAKTIGSEHGMELWQGKRIVREFLPGE